MQSLGFFILLAISCVQSWPGGAPNCGVSVPGHGPSTAQENDLQLVHHKTKSQAAEDGNLWFIIINRPRATFKGFLIQPDANTSGVFSEGYNTTYFQGLENNKCITHVDNSEKSGVIMLQFKSDSEEPVFNIFMVGSSKEQWWKIDL